MQKKCDNKSDKPIVISVLKCRKMEARRGAINIKRREK